MVVQTPDLSGRSRNTVVTDQRRIPAFRSGFNRIVLVFALDLAGELLKSSARYN